MLGLAFLLVELRPAFDFSGVDESRRRVQFVPCLEKGLSRVAVPARVPVEGCRSVRHPGLHEERRRDLFSILALEGEGELPAVVERTRFFVAADGAQSL